MSEDFESFSLTLNTNITSFGNDMNDSLSNISDAEYFAKLLEMIRENRTISQSAQVDYCITYS